MSFTPIKHFQILLMLCLSVRKSEYDKGKPLNPFANYIYISALRT